MKASILIGITLILFLITFGCVTQLSEADDLNDTGNGDYNYIGTDINSLTFGEVKIDFGGDVNANCITLADGNRVCGFNTIIYETILSPIDTNYETAGYGDLNTDLNYVPYIGASFDVDLGTHNAIANSFRADAYEQTISASEQTITHTGQNSVALTYAGEIEEYVLGSTNPVFNDGTQIGQVMVVRVVDFGLDNSLTIKDNAVNGKVNLLGDKVIGFASGGEDVLIVQWDGSLWQEVYRNLGYSNSFSGDASGWGTGNDFTGLNAGWGLDNEFSGQYSGWGRDNTFSNNSAGWGYLNEFTGQYSGWGRLNEFSGTESGWGVGNDFTGQASGWGLGNVATAYQASFGRYSTDQGHATNWVATDDLFKIGIGTGTSARADAFRLLKDGESHWETDQKHYYGLGNDASIQYNGLNFIIDPKENGTGQLQVDGDLNQYDGNAFINGIYGELNASHTTVTIGSSGVYYDLLDTNAGLLNGFTVTDGNLIADYGGVYGIVSQWSFSGGVTNEYHLSLKANMIQENKCHSERKLGTGGDVGSASYTCLISINAGDKIVPIIENATAGTDATVHAFQLTAIRIGN